VLKKAAKRQSFFPVVKTSKVQKVKKLPAGLRQALREVEQGKLSGPFHSVDEFMAGLKKR